MAAESRPPDHPVVARLRERPREFAFFQAVRLLELAHPESAPLGGQGPPSREAVRLRPSSSLAFQAAEVTRFEPLGESGDRLTTTIMGLYGTNSPLPGFYSTDILEWETQRGGEDDPVRAFLDLINHRLLSLLYRAWSKYRWAFTFRLGVADDISRSILALAGIGAPELREALGIPAQRVLRFTGLVSQTPRSARGVARAVSDYFGEVPVEIQQCIEHWVPIHPADRSRLGTHNAGLGADLVLGESILDRGSRFRLEIGPLEALPDFERFTPGGAHHRDLGGLVAFLVSDPLEYDVRLGLVAEAVPMARLSSGAEASKLGGTSWLCSEPAAAEKWELFAPADLREAA